MLAALPSADPTLRVMVTPRLAAAALGISERKLWSLTVPRGPIPCVRIGKSVRYRVEALQEFARTLEARAANEKAPAR